ncbi:MAG: rhomboid family intramembrane serine protease [Armatimonadota bacterium]|nr:MAG: rhomboid family intramembrane serine protease [Armatimonadota bacterium]
MFFLLPYATERPRRRTPFATYGLLVANCVVFLFYQLPYWADGHHGAGPFGFVPSAPETRALVVSMFSHGGLGHLFWNMLFLWLFGSIVEDVLGPVMFLGFYLGGQMGATLLDVSIAKAFAPASLIVPRVGASGAIAGILGLSAVCFSGVRIKVAYFFGIIFLWRVGVWRIPAWFFLGLWIAVQFVGGFFSTSLSAATGQAVGGVAYWAHIGGVAAGMVGAVLLALPGKIRRHDLLQRTPVGEDGGSRRYADLHDLVRRAPEDAEAWLALAHSKESYGATTEAAEAYARAATLFLEHREPERAARAYKAVLAYDPTFVLSAPAQFDIALGFARSGDYRDALTALDKLLQAYPSSQEAEVAFLRAGELAERIGEPDAALEYFQELTRRYPHSVWADHARHRIRALRG